MEQHPIPQQISSYQFKLVGDMTLAQFGKAAGGIVIAVQSGGRDSNSGTYKRIWINIFY